VPRTIVSVDEFPPWHYGIVDFVSASIGRNTYYNYHVSTIGGHKDIAILIVSCRTQIWPPKSVKDSGSRLHSKLKEAILQTGMEKNIFGNHPVSLSVTESRSPPPAFSSDPLISRENLGNSQSVDGPELSRISVTDIVEIDGANSGGNFMNSSPVAPGATTRKGSVHVDRQNSEISYYADDEDAKRKKYTKRGPFHHKFLRALLPFWSSALPTLPVTAPARKDGSNAAEASEARTRHQKSSRMDPRKILLLIAIMYSSFLFLACMATMGILYYRLVQRGPGDELLNNDE
ncbi:zinc finger protein 1-like, partial [Trifolium pratense]